MTSSTLSIIHQTREKRPFAVAKDRLTQPEFRSSASEYAPGDSTCQNVDGAAHFVGLETQHLGTHQQGFSA